MSPAWTVRTMRGEVEHTSHEAALYAAANLAVAWAGMPVHIVYPTGVTARLAATVVGPTPGVTASGRDIAAANTRAFCGGELAVAAGYVADLEADAAEAFRVAWEARAEADRLMELAYAAQHDYKAARDALAAYEAAGGGT